MNVRTRQPNTIAILFCAFSVAMTVQVGCSQREPSVRQMKTVQEWPLTFSRLPTTLDRWSQGKDTSLTSKPDGYMLDHQEELLRHARTGNADAILDYLQRVEFEHVRDINKEQVVNWISRTLDPDYKRLSAIRILGHMEGYAPAMSELRRWANDKSLTARVRKSAAESLRPANGGPAAAGDSRIRTPP